MTIAMLYRSGRNGKKHVFLLFFQIFRPMYGMIFIFTPSLLLAQFITPESISSPKSPIPDLTYSS